MHVIPPQALPRFIHLFTWTPDECATDGPAPEDGGHSTAQASFTAVPFALTISIERPSLPRCS
jgi:hypothetical protein